MSRRLAAVLMALLVIFPSTTLASDSPWWEVSSRGQIGSIDLHADASTRDRAEIGATSTTELAGDEGLVRDALNVLGINGGFSQDLHWNESDLRCASLLFCFGEQGFAVMIGTAERQMLVERLLSSGEIKAYSSVEAVPVMVDAALFVGAFVLSKVPLIDPPLAQQLIVNIAFAIWPDVEGIVGRAMAGDLPGVVSSLKELLDSAFNVIRDGMLTVAGSEILEKVVKELLKDVFGLAFAWASFIVAAGQYAVVLVRTAGAVATGDRADYTISYTAPEATATPSAPPTASPTPLPAATLSATPGGAAVATAETCAQNGLPYSDKYEICYEDTPPESPKPPDWCLSAVARARDSVNGLGTLLYASFPRSEDARTGAVSSSCEGYAPVDGPEAQPVSPSIFFYSYPLSEGLENCDFVMSANGHTPLILSDCVEGPVSGLGGAATYTQWTRAWDYRTTKRRATSIELRVGGHYVAAGYRHMIVPGAASDAESVRIATDLARVVLPLVP